MYEDIVEIKKNGRECVLVTVVDREGHGPGIIGAKMIVIDDGTTKGTVGGGALELLATEKATEVLNSKTAFSQKYILNQDQSIEYAQKTGMICGGTATLYFEYISSGIPVYIYGGGHVGRALSYHLKDLGYYVTVLDHRPEIFGEENHSNRNLIIDYVDMFREAKIVDGCYILIATPSHNYDYSVVKGVLGSSYKPRYIGLLGSQKKANDFVDRLMQDLGKDIDLRNLYMPVGLDTGGGTPNEIAISIIAEMQSVRYDKNGNKHMKEII